jgi:HD-like signal output (HDOD) protein
MAIKGSVAWINYLDKIELPVLSNTLKSICLVTESDKVKIEELVKVILNDADLTSKVLKLANSVCYNPQQFSISTMSRAIVQIGFESIKAIAISSALVDQLSQKNNQKQLFHSLVRSFHAAVQAKYMASDYSLEEQETIFIAALLFDVGEAAFWSCSSSTTHVLEDRVNCHANQFINDQKEILGTSFKSISRGLVKSWHLGPLLEECLKSPTTRQARIVCAAIELAHHHEQNPNKGRLDELIKSIALMTDKSDVKIKEDLQKNTLKAASLAEQFGIKGAKAYLKVHQARRQLKANTQKQFESLLHISEFIAAGKSWDVVLNLILESMHSSIGFERCALFVAKPNSSHYKIYKYTGFATKDWLSKPELYVKPLHPFDAILNSKETKLLPAETCLQRADTLMAEGAPFTGLIPAIIGSFNWPGHFHGFIYADRLNQAEIDRSQVSSFRLFIQQIQLLFSA